MSETKSCYDCNNDTTTDGYTDPIDGAYFCMDCQTQRNVTKLAELVMEKWGAENGVKYLTGVISTLVTDAQIRVLITAVEKSSRFI